MSLSRRQMLRGVAAFGGMALGGPAAGAAAPRLATPAPRRIAVLDWAMAETAVALGLPPVAMVEPARYRDRAQDPDLPGDVIDLGLMTQPDLERLLLLHPDLIVTGHGQAETIGPALARIAPVWEGSIYTGDGAPLDAACRVTRDLGERLGQAEAAEAAIARALARIDAAAARIGEGVRRLPVAVFIFQDPRHGWIADRNGFIAAVMDRMGLTPAWTGPGSFWGYTAIGIDRLAALPDCRLIYADLPVTETGGWTPDASTIWQALPPVAAGHAQRIGPFWYFGALPTMARFADQLADALTGAGKAGDGEDAGEGEDSGKGEDACEGEREAG
ncbi:ABC transporter substrate-binding protein (plasmid) [Tistrella mobilis]|uniref:ABC transporter substrate-binding protein n=1 Tax=Tistrella mobilis TaxID=171437 RepID=UPI003558D1DB